MTKTVREINDEKIFEITTTLSTISHEMMILTGDREETSCYERILLTHWMQELEEINSFLQDEMEK